MKLFRTKATPHSAPEPAPVSEQRPDALALAISEEAGAANAVREAADRCAALGMEQKSWSQRRDAANRAFVTALQRHASAKADLTRLSRPMPVALGAVIAGEN